MKCTGAESKDRKKPCLNYPLGQTTAIPRQNADGGPFCKQRLPGPYTLKLFWVVGFGNLLPLGKQSIVLLAACYLRVDAIENSSQHDHPHRFGICIGKHSDHYLYTASFCLLTSCLGLMISSILSAFSLSCLLSIIASSSFDALF